MRDQMSFHNMTKPARVSPLRIVAYGIGGSIALLATVASYVFIGLLIVGLV